MGYWQAAFWVFVVALVAGLYLVTRPEVLARLRSSRRLRQLGASALDALRPVEEHDQQAADLYRAVRRERLRADLHRLQRLLVTDETMSATRQLGNRLAHDWVLRELRELGGAPPDRAYVNPRTAWEASSVAAQPAWTAGSTKQGSVETLDVRLWP